MHGATIRISNDIYKNKGKEKPQLEKELGKAADYRRCYLIYT